MDPAPLLATTWRRAASGATLLVALLTLVSALTPGEPWRDDLLTSVEPEMLLSLGHVVAALAGLVLIGLSRSMIRGTKRAVDITVVLLVAVAVLNMAKGLDYEEGALTLTLAALLVAGRGAFTRGTTSRPGLVAGAAAVGVLTAAYALSIAPLLVHRHPHDAFSAGLTALQSSGWFLRPDSPLALALNVAVAAVVAASVVFIWGLLRPQAGRDGHRSQEHERAVELVDRHGSDSLDPFLLREDKSFFFAHGGVLAYRVLRDTAIVSGDPVGPAGAPPLILAAFIEHADRNGWRVALQAASGQHVGAYRAMGLHTLRVGEEAVVDSGAFSLEGRRIRKVRQSVARVTRHGWSTEISPAAAITEADHRDIVALEDEWRASQQRVHGFAMTLGRLGGAPEDEQMLYVLARGADGRIGALLRFAPYIGGLSLDAMRRHEDAPNGVTEAMVVAGLLHAREHGRQEVSLNFAGFGHIMAEGRDLNRLQRALRLALGAAHSRFQLERLTAFNQKFDPVWRPRYLVYGRRSELPRAALRVLQAEAYIRPPRARTLPARWTAPAWQTSRTHTP